MSVAAGSNPRSEYQPIPITGTTGFVGMEVMARFLQRSQRHVFALIRAPTDADAHQRLRAVLATAFGDADAYRGRVTAVAGDIERPDLGLDPRRLDELTEQVNRVLHAAASVSFELALVESRGINVRGTQHMLAFVDRAQQRGGLERFTYVSGVSRGLGTSDRSRRRSRGRPRAHRVRSCRVSSPALRKR